MKPEEMTNEQLLEARDDVVASSASFCEGFGSVHTEEEAEQCYHELLRRLNELDALRKENEELRKDAERYRFIRDNADTIAINSSLQYCDIYRSEGIEEGLDTAMKFESDYAAKAKESEASHEH